ncbi:hypothetical protein ACSBR1_005652 [Camellia fascicularis]
MKIVPEVEVFESLAVLLSELDVLLSFADLAISCPIPYTRPDITTSDVGDIVSEGSRHPCVEAQDWVNLSQMICNPFEYMMIPLQVDIGAYY